MYKMLPPEGYISYTPITFYSQEMTLFYLLDLIAKKKKKKIRKKKANKILKDIKDRGRWQFFLSFTT